MVGDFEVTVLSDGTVKLPMARSWWTRIPRRSARAGPQLHEGRRRDLGQRLPGQHRQQAGADRHRRRRLFGPTLGNLLANMRAAGYQPEQVDEIYITHMHGDHVGGLMAGANRAFPMPRCGWTSGTRTSG
jgi:glyoxylase-like metal-dependent hydrolase (beta-lactamase superfamily II)